MHLGKTIIINTANLQKGGALQVAASFVDEASRVPSVNFVVILGKASSDTIIPEHYIHFTHLKFYKVNLLPTQSPLHYIQFGRALSRIEKEVNPDAVITIFGPCYWKPQARHIMGFANGYLLYDDTYFFKIWSGWRSWKFNLKKKFHQYLLKREADLLWTETEDSRKRLAKFVDMPLQRIVVASNNCSNFFRSESKEVFRDLPKSKATRLLYVSSYYPHKGFELIPPVLEILKKRAIDVEIILTIRNDDYQRIFGGLDNVINLGPVNPKYCPDLYRQSNIIFAPTLLETFTAVYPEAMYSQIPIVTTDLPFARDICRDAALYFDPASPADAADKIQQLIEDENLRNRLIHNGLNRVEDFDLPEARFQKVLKAVLCEK